MRNDEITIEFLDNGLMKMETNGVSAANHNNAEQLLRAIAADVGGKVTIKKKHKHGHTHTHNHVHEGGESK